MQKLFRFRAKKPAQTFWFMNIGLGTAQRLMLVFADQFRGGLHWGWVRGLCVIRVDSFSINMTKSPLLISEANVASLSRATHRFKFAFIHCDLCDSQSQSRKSEKFSFSIIIRAFFYAFHISIKQVGFIYSAMPCVSFSIMGTRDFHLHLTCSISRSRSGVDEGKTLRGN